MAFPSNPLDRFATYTYHFMLVASHSTKAIDELHWDRSLPTAQSYGTFMGFREDTVLLINTFTDAAQVIENLDFTTAFTSFSDAPLVISSDFSFQVTESSGTYFMEKLVLAMHGLGLTGIGDMVLGLSIDFVGRTPDDVVETERGPVIKMVLTNLDAEYDHRGAVYTLQCAPVEYGAQNVNPRDAVVGRNLCLSGRTVGDLFADLESKLNTEIDMCTNREVEKDARGRTLKYSFDAGPYKGFLVDSIIKQANLNQENVARRVPNPGNGNKDVHVNFLPNRPILAILNDILLHSPGVSQLIAQSAKEADKPGFGKSSAYKIEASYESDDLSVTYRYAVRQYSGVEVTNGVNAGPDFTFNYFYTGLNTDVISFNMKLEQQLGYLLNYKKNSNSFLNWANANDTNTISNEKNDANAAVVNNDIERKRAELIRSVGRFDCTRPPPYTRVDANGMIKKTEHDAKLLKGHLDVVSKLSGAPGSQFNAKIRGHLDILFGSSSRDKKKPSPGFDHPMRVKMVVRNQNLENFWYDGTYVVFTVKNSFANGMFTQELVGFADETMSDRYIKALDAGKQKMAEQRDNKSKIKTATATNDTNGTWTR